MEDEESTLRTVDELLRSFAERSLSQDDRVAAASTLESLVRSRRIRDIDDVPRNTYRLLFEALYSCWDAVPPSAAANASFQRAFGGWIATPEFICEVAEPYISDDLLRCLVGRFEVTQPEEAAFLRDTLHWLYSSFPEKRSSLRTRIGGVLSRFKRSPHKGVRVNELLEVLGQVVRGFSTPLTAIHKDLLFRVLIPLHQPNEMAEWRDQLPLLQMYHEPLVYCLNQFLEKDPSLVVKVIEGVVTHWPEGFHSNTPKEVLLLHEVEALLQHASSEDFGALIPSLLPHLLRCLSVENSRVVERALFMWKNVKFRTLVASHTQRLMQPLMEALLRGGTPFWNPTVNKLVAHVLQQLEEMDPTSFAAAAERIWGANTQTQAVTYEPQERSSQRPPSQPASVAIPNASAVSVAPGNVGGVPSVSRGAGGFMGAWRPGAGSGPPPSTITGVAPWAFSQNGGAKTERGASQNFPRKRPLPSSAYRPPAPGGGTGGAKMCADTDVDMKECDGETQEDKETAGDSKMSDEPKESKGSTASDSKDSEDQAAPKEGIGLTRLRAFMLVLRPGGDPKNTQTALSPWVEDQALPTPTLLPTLKFHDLVFGRDLGSGTFGTVRYARLITREKPRAEWPEYAVKVIDADSLARHRYKTAAVNEVAVLRLLSHPGIARMVSAFRWRRGYYLVLEYGARGDLHSLIVKSGSLDEESTRFVSAEIVAALCAVHDAGFVYGDLKPENCVITEAGHVKLADFGACRPATAHAVDLLKSSRHALRDMRDGEWHATPASETQAPESMVLDDSDNEGSENSDEEEKEELRVEGTAAYLAPEVIRGGVPSLLSDSWALGCLVYHCLSGRPPVTANTDEETKEGVVRFSISQGTSALSHLPASTSPAASSLVTSLLMPDANLRLPISAVGSHPFFTDHSVDVHGRYKMPPAPLLAGAVGPAPEAAAWTRRQNSMIWAPMPQEYSLETPHHELSIILETPLEAGAGFVAVLRPIDEEFPIPMKPKR